MNANEYRTAVMDATADTNARRAMVNQDASERRGTISIGGGDANGYFSTWIAFIASAMYMFGAVPQISAASSQVTSGGNEKGMLLVIFLASVCEMWAAAYICDQGAAGCRGVVAWAVSCGAISAFLSLLFAFVPQLAGFVKYLAAFLAIWWAAGVATLTFQYTSTRDVGWIFTSAGNGYFGCWVAFFCSFILAYVTLFGGSIPSASGMPTTQQAKV